LKRINLNGELSMSMPGWPMPYVKPAWPPKPGPIRSKRRQMFYERLSEARLYVCLMIYGVCILLVVWVICGLASIVLGIFWIAMKGLKWWERREIKKRQRAKGDSKTDGNKSY